MAKRELKRKLKDQQNGTCEISGAELPEDTSLFDTDRRVPKSQGGSYDGANPRAINPVVHMMRHGNWREREPALELLKQIVDDREQVRKTCLKVENQLKAYERRVDSLHQITLEWLQNEVKAKRKDLADRDKALKHAVRRFAEIDPLTKAALGVKGIGEVTVAYCLVYIDLTKARHASSLWAYAGLDKPAHERFTKGVKGGGNKSLRTVLYTMADSQMKGRNRGSAYGYLYDRVKTRLENSEKIVKTRVYKQKGQPTLVEKPWKEVQPLHRHMAALRQIMKHFLADWWYVGRSLMGLPVGPLYPEAVLGGNHRTVMPEERGWIYQK